jgi:hypothetical protein
MTVQNDGVTVGVALGYLGQQRSEKAYGVGSVALSVQKEKKAPKKLAILV